MIVPMTAAHVPACAALVAATDLFAATYGMTAEGMARALTGALDDPRHVLLVAGDAQGFAWFVPRGTFDRSGYLRLLAVDARHRRAGVGARLMEALESRFLAPGGITLLVTSTNAPARAFYESRGYVHRGDLPDYVRPGVTECLYYRAPK
jgi:ribosomal protein S18 acetylase RimI-like enzyme